MRKAPEKPVIFNLRMSRELYEKIKKEAEKEGRTITATIIRQLEKKFSSWGAAA